MHPIYTVLRIHALLLVFVMSVACLAAALYLQHVLDWQPCPLCVLQRLAFIAVGVFAGIGWCLRTAPTPVFRSVQGVALLSALAGVAAAGRHVWVKAHPSVSCGVDPLETVINAQWWVQKLPWLLKADGLCFLPLPPLLGLQLPVWSLLILLLAALLIVLAQRRATG